MRYSLAASLVLIVAVLGCLKADRPSAPSAEGGPSDRKANADQDHVESRIPQPADIPVEEEPEFVKLRQVMIDKQIIARGIRDGRVLDALTRVPRHQFVPLQLSGQAYDDRPLPIGHEQTISQPYIVALMTELARPQPGDRALEVGTGCGYQAAVLAELVDEVYSIEIVRSLADEARERLQGLGYANIHVRSGDGYQGWAEHAPFQVIVVTAAPDHVPQPLIQQLAPGGRLVIPVGRYFQELRLLEKLPDGQLRESKVAPVRFVPMTGEAQRR